MTDPQVVTCLPLSMCTWDYRVEGLASGPAELRFKTFSEQGVVQVAGHELVVAKQGAASGRWALEHEGLVVAGAHKPSSFRTEFLLTSAGRSWRLARAGSFTRTFQVFEDEEGDPVAAFEPMHAFTRRATLTHAGGIPDPVLLFAFWLAALIWKRDASSS